MSSIPLRALDQAQFNSAVTTHLLYLRDRVGNIDKRADFSNCSFVGIDMSEVDLREALFVGAALNGVKSRHYPQPNAPTALRWADLSGADFSNSDVSAVDFTAVWDIKGAIFIGAKFNEKKFTKEQLSKIILTENERKLSQELALASNQIEADGKAILEKDAILERTSESAMNQFELIFKTLTKGYSREERLWMIFVWMTFLAILILSFFPVLFSMGYLSIKEAFSIFIIATVSIFWVSISTTIDVLNGHADEKEIF